MTTLRVWATPVTIGAFLLTAVTGILMFFHADIGLNKFAHEWLSWALVAGVAMHLAVNFRAMKGYFKRPRAIAIMAAFATLLVVSFFSFGNAGGGSPVELVMNSVATAPLEQVIALSGDTTEVGLARLQDAGISAQATVNIQALSGGNRGQAVEILRIILGS